MSLRNLSLLGGATPSSLTSKYSLSLVEMVLIVFGAYLLFNYLSKHKEKRMKSKRNHKEPETPKAKVTEAPKAIVTEAPKAKR